MKYLIYLLFFWFAILNLSAQIPVAEEPLHHVIFEDTDVRILEIVALPGDTALMHRHDYNYCYLATKGGKLWLEDEGKESRTVDLPSHYCGGKFDLEINPFVHRFSNIDTKAIQFFTIEHKGNSTNTFRSEDFQDAVILENDLFRVRKLKLDPLSSFSVRHGGKSFLLNIDQKDKLYANTQMVPYWTKYENSEKIYLSNMSDSAILVAIFEIF